MIFQKYRGNRGFTIIEILVVLSIISLLTILTLTQYRTGQKSFALQRAAHQLAQDIRRAQEMAMSAKEINGFPPRYGVEFDTIYPDYYILFADDNDNGKREVSDQIIETINLEKGINIDQVFVGEPLSSKAQIWITFKPPDPITEIRDPAAAESSIAKIQLTNDNKTKSIVVNKAGLIYVE